MRAILALLAYTGLGPKDAVSLPRSAFRDGEIATRRTKTGEPVFWPAPALLRAELAAMPDALRGNQVPPTFRALVSDLDGALA